MRIAFLFPVLLMSAAATAEAQVVATPLAPNGTAAAICGPHYQALQDSCADPAKAQECARNRANYNRCLIGYGNGEPNTAVIPPPPKPSESITYEKE